jgi:hypothetical protein
MSVATRSVPDEERAIELIAQIATVNNYRDFLVDVKDSTFRIKHCEEIGFSEVCTLRSAFLIEDSGIEMGYQTDWQLTDQARYLLEHVDEDVTLDDDEVDALLSAGQDVFHLPPAEADSWRIRELHGVEITSPSLSELRKADLIEADSEPIGHPVWWQTTQRLDQIRSLLSGITQA